MISSCGTKAGSWPFGRTQYSLIGCCDKKYADEIKSLLARYPVKKSAVIRCISPGRIWRTRPNHDSFDILGMPILMF